MRYVEVAPVIDVLPYLAEVPRLAVELPPGAAAFLTDPDHYDFYGVRCVKDLELRELRLVGEDRFALDLVFGPNQWKHDDGLTVSYVQPVGIEIDARRGVTVGPKQIGPLIVDEMLPDPAGVRHEMAFHGGTIVVTAGDLRAIWRSHGS